MPYSAARLAKVRRFHKRRVWLNEKINEIFEIASSRLPLCGNGKRHNWSVLVADALLYAPCACCTIFRSLTIGFVIGFIFANII